MFQENEEEPFFYVFFIAIMLLNVISYIHIFKLVSLQIAHGTMVQKKKELPGPHCSENEKGREQVCT